MNTSELATITIENITIIDILNNDTVTINTSNFGQGDHEFAIDNEFSCFQDEREFKGHFTLKY